MMLGKYFVALTFKNDSTLYRKIDGLKKSFDPKYTSRSFPHMSMLAPFLMNTRDEENLKETLKEEIGTYFYGFDGAMKLGFNGIDIYSHKRKHILYLNPAEDATVDHCIDLTRSICESFIPRGTGYKQNKKQFLPLGEFHHSNTLSKVLPDLKEQFSSLSQLRVDSIVLLKKNQGKWQVFDELINFEDNFDKRLQIETLSL
ncbi:MAG: 2'-5' RNA ligase family protein [Bacteriovoracaceae bacterium]|jgi:hypothetical protein|nr:2'-5' RNA ligase family protein [Bacteriovoracaceae bacterium]